MQSESKWGDSVEASIKSKLNEIDLILKEDDGGVEFVDFEGGVLKVRLKGACSGCEMSEMTVSMIIEDEMLKHDKRVKKIEVVE